MPQLNTITINDGAATPVAHSFAPVTTDGFLARLKERVGAIAAAFAELSIAVREPLKGQTDKVYRITEKLRVPVAVTVSGVTSIDHTNSVSIEFLISEKATAQERKDIRVLAYNLLGHAATIAAVESLEPQF